MSAKDLAAKAVSDGMSVRLAAKTYGIGFSKLQNHILIQDRPVSIDPKHQEALISAAVESVESKRLSIFAAAKHYGVAYGTVYGRIKRNRCADRGRPTKLSKEDEDILADILAKLATLNVGLAKPALMRLPKTGVLKGRHFIKQGKMTNFYSKTNEMNIKNKTDKNCCADSKKSFYECKKLEITANKPLLLN